MASSTSSSSSASASATLSGAVTVHKHSNRTIGLAVGLGVGVPILLTVLILTWVTIRHHRKLREEDEIHKEIDFNGDVTFWSPEQAQIARFDRRNDLIDDSNLTQNRSSNNTGSTTLSASTGSLNKREKQGHVSETVVPADIESRASEDDGPARRSTTSYAGSGSTPMGAPPSGGSNHPGDHNHTPGDMSHIYTPEFMFSHGSQETFSKALHSVYGPSPAYPSTEKLRAPSIASLRSQHTGTAGSIYGSTYGGSMHNGYAGPFATPPRNHGSSVFGFGNRRLSAGSTQIEDNTSLAGFEDSTSTPHLAQPQTPLHAQAPLGQLRESPHPYADLAGAQNFATLHKAAADVPDHEAGTHDPASPSKNDDDDGERKNARHAYYQQTQDRTSKFEFI